MARPSKNQDKLLIEAGKKLLPKHGASGMSIQQIVDEAGVNLGMFNYYFKTKANFILCVIDALKKDLPISAQFKIKNSATSIEKLREFLICMAKKFRDENNLVLSLLKDFLNEDPDIIDMVFNNSAQQLNMLRNMIQDCQNDGYIKRNIPIKQIELYCNSAVKGPIIISSAINRIKNKYRIKPSEIQKEILTDTEIIEIIEMTLCGIAT